ncbi:MAG: hypothetical protein IPK10_16230 [Bacteroidetes bacterium]|nr:hypothetical protein [Bacteroidota bacterium]
MLDLNDIKEEDTKEFKESIDNYIQDLGDSSSIDYFLDEIMNFPEYSQEKKKSLKQSPKL